MCWRNEEKWDGKNDGKYTYTEWDVGEEERRRGKMIKGRKEKRKILERTIGKEKKYREEERKSKKKKLSMKRKREKLGMMKGKRKN